MEEKREIENRIDDLNWRALPLYDRLMMKKWQLRERNYCCKDRRRELKAMIRMSNLAIFIFSACLVYILFFTSNYSPGLCWLFICSVIMLFVQRIELSFQLMCLKEVKFLKKVKKKFSIRNYMKSNR